MLEVTGKQAIEIYNVLDKNLPIANLSSLTKEERKVIRAVLKYIKVSNLKKDDEIKTKELPSFTKKEGESSIIIKNIIAKLQGKSPDVVNDSSLNQKARGSSGHRLNSANLKNNIDLSLGNIGRREMKLKEKKLEVESLRIQIKEIQSVLDKSIKKLEESQRLKKILSEELKQLLQNPSKPTMNGQIDNGKLKESMHLKRNQLKSLKLDISDSKHTIKKCKRMIDDSLKRTAHLEKIIGKEERNANKQYFGRFIVD